MKERCKGMRMLTSAGPIPQRTTLLLTTGCLRGTLEAFKHCTSAFLSLSLCLSSWYQPLGYASEYFCFYFLVPTKLLCYVLESCDTAVSYSVTALVCSSHLYITSPLSATERDGGPKRRKGLKERKAHVVPMCWFYTEDVLNQRI